MHCASLPYGRPAGGGFKVLLCAGAKVSGLHCTPPLYCSIAWTVERDLPPPSEHGGPKQSALICHQSCYCFWRL